MQGTVLSFESKAADDGVVSSTGLDGVVYTLEQGTSLSEALPWGVVCGTVTAGLDGTAFGDRETVARRLPRLTSQ